MVQTRSQFGAQQGQNKNQSARLWAHQQQGHPLSSQQVKAAVAPSSQTMGGATGHPLLA
jgi:hypothetical protein